jgi:PEGA domain
MTRTIFVLIAIACATPASAQPPSDFGTVSVTVRPTTADVFIDGDRWVSPDLSVPLVVQLAPGRHSVDVRAPGHRPFSTVVDIRRGEATPLNVSLPASFSPPEFGNQPPPSRPPGPIRQVSAARPSDDGFVFATDFKITEMNHRTTGFAGFYGGVVFAGQAMIGGGAYFQLDDWNSEQMAYGGLVAEYRLFHDHPVGVTLHGLAGYGATNVPIYGHHGGHGYGYGYGYCSSYPYGYGYGYGCPYDGFFIGEPEVQVAARVSRSVRIVGGIGYRFTSADVYDLNGVMGSITVQIGK